jgi:hypothetical protein
MLIGASYSRGAPGYGPDLGLRHLGAALLSLHQGLDGVRDLTDSARLAQMQVGPATHFSKHTQ